MTEKKTHKTWLLGYHESTVSLFKSGKRPPSWNLAEKLCEIFPGKNIKQWKGSSPKEIARAFDQLRAEAKEKVA